jgi:hypothetical protein
LPEMYLDIPEAFKVAFKVLGSVIEFALANE